MAASNSANPSRNASTSGRRLLLLSLLVGLGLGILIGRLTFARAGSPPSEPPASSSSASPSHTHGDHSHGADDHGDHDHEEEGHAGHDHDDASAIELTPQARKTLGLEVTQIELKPFERTISVPGMVIERPGRSTVEITAPMTGVITHIFPIQGEAVMPGQPLFELRLSHEDMVQAQSEFLRTVEELDVVLREITRLEKLVESGAIPGKNLLERNYEKQKIEGALRAQEQALLLHGLTEAQVDAIRASRSLLRLITVFAPQTEDAPEDEKPRPLQVQTLEVDQGHAVRAGTTLCVLVDHAELYIEGRAFEQDVTAINEAAAQGLSVMAQLESSDGKEAAIGPLKILYLSDKVDAASRAFRFYVTLPNEMLRQLDIEKQGVADQFIYWKYKPGQRMQLRVPVERWADRIVLPIGAVVVEGAENYVFEVDDDHFHRRAVHVEYRDQTWAVLANDGSILPGDSVVSKGAFQLQVAMKNRSGGAMDPHAGHTH